jgi:hypothetical protein
VNESPIRLVKSSPQPFGEARRADVNVVDVWQTASDVFPPQGGGNALQKFLVEVPILDATQQLMCREGSRSQVLVTVVETTCDDVLHVSVDYLDPVRLVVSEAVVRRRIG